MLDDSTSTVEKADVGFVGDFRVSSVQVYLAAWFYAAKKDFLQKQNSAHTQRNVKIVRVQFIIIEGLHQCLVKDKDKYSAL